jgi:hypothetical protein
VVVPLPAVLVIEDKDLHPAVSAVTTTIYLQVAFAAVGTRTFRCEA